MTDRIDIDVQTLRELANRRGVYWLLGTLAQVVRERWAGTDNAALGDRLAKIIEAARDSA